MSSGLSDTEAEAGRESGTREGLKVPSGSIVRASMSTDGLAQKGAGRVSRCNPCEKDETPAEETEGGWSGRCGGSACCGEAERENSGKCPWGLVTGGSTAWRRLISGRGTAATN